MSILQIDTSINALMNIQAQRLQLGNTLNNMGSSLTGKVLYELLLGIIDWKSWLLFEQTDRYKLLKDYFKMSKDS